MLGQAGSKVGDGAPSRDNPLTELVGNQLQALIPLVSFLYNGHLIFTSS
jgi:hypothetical protein